MAAARAAALPAGAVVLDLDQVRPEIPEALAELREAIERERVLFEVGSGALDDIDRRTIGRVADGFGRMEAGAAALGARATLELVGRTDPTGSDSTNRALSQERAEAVLRALAVRGVPRSKASLRALGTGQPLGSSNPAERARINRSVSFQVSLEVGPGEESSR